MNKVRRDQTLDIARGFAIVAIVVGHVGRGLSDSGLMSQSAYADWDRALYMCHLTVFVLVSGLLVPGAVERHGRRKFVTDRVRLFLYLYALWSVIQGGVRVVLSEFTNTPVTLEDVFELWTPRGQMWYLPFIAAATALVTLCMPWSPVGRVSIAGAWALSFGLWGMQGSWIFTQGWPLLGALFLGAAVGRRRVSTWGASLRARGWTLVALLAAVLYLGLLASPAQPPTYQAIDRTAAGIALGAVTSIVGVALVLASSALVALTASRLGGWIAALGQQSLPIYLAHIVFASGVRIGLSSIGLEDTTIHLMLGVAAGIILPVVLARLTAQGPAAALFSDAYLTSGLRRMGFSAPRDPSAGRP